MSDDARRWKPGDKAMVEIVDVGETTSGTPWAQLRDAGAGVMQSALHPLPVSGIPTMRNGEVWLRVQGLGMNAPVHRFPDWIEVTQVDHPDCKFRLRVLDVQSALPAPDASDAK